MATSNLVVEVTSADIPSSSNTSPANYFAEVCFNGQNARTAIKQDVAVWNERFCFDMRQRDKGPCGDLILEAAVYSCDQISDSKSLLGKVLLSDEYFHRHGANVDPVQYPLLNSTGHENGKVLLKLFLIDAADRILLESEGNNGLNDIYDYLFKSKDGYVEDDNVDQHGPVSLEPDDAAPTEINPNFEAGRLVERMQLLFVRVIKARKLPDMDANGSLDPYVEVQFGAFNRGVTKCLKRSKNPEWKETFAFSFQFQHGQTPNPGVDVIVNDKDVVKDDFVGKVHFDLKDIPTRSPDDDAPLEPTWYPLLDQCGTKLEQASLLLTIWIGSQADEAYRDVWVSLYSSKVYEKPNLWWLRVTIVEVQGVTVRHDDGAAADGRNAQRDTELRCRARLGKQIQRTRAVTKQTTTSGSYEWRYEWKQDLLLVAAEPFFEGVLELEAVIDSSKTVIGQLILPLSAIGTSGDMPVPDRWFDLTRPAAAVQLEDSVDIANSRMRICLNVILDGRYHIVHDSRGYLDDTRPADRALWRAPIGRVHLGILRATGLPLRKNRSAMNPYCVAKYGDKWVRTRTVLDDGGAEHVFNEQHTWSVYDIATVLTVGVFDHCPDAPHREIGKVRIHLSSLERGRIYAHSYRLIILERDGVKRTGELQLAVKLSCGIALLRTYARPVLPGMHYTHPLSATENEELRSGAANVMALRLGRAEPPLRSEVVACMCSAAASGYHHWSLRKSKANFHRLVQLASPFVSLFHGVESVRSWRDPAATLLALAIFFVALWFHDLVPTMLFLCIVFKGVWNYRFRPTLPPYVDYRVSYLDVVHPDELDEEFDTFKSSREANLLRMRYDRLRMISGRVQTVVGDIASQGEKIRSLLSWRDPRATAIFQLFLLTAAVVVYLAPKKLLVGLAGLYIMRPPRYREKNTPSTIASFISRLPSNRDNLM